jgi:hypothetical protein
MDRLFRLHFRSKVQTLPLFRSVGGSLVAWADPRARTEISLEQLFKHFGEQGMLHWTVDKGLQAEATSKGTNSKLGFFRLI